MHKSTVDEIRQRFDREVERFSNLESGQSATIDAPLVLDLVTAAAAAVTPAARAMLDVGCGAGNYTIKLLERLPGLDVTLLDLSCPMLERAVARLAPLPVGRVQVFQGDIRDVTLAPASVDIVLAAAVLHHLRDDAEWRAVFAKLHTALRPGGSLWITDLVEHSEGAVQALMWERYGAYLTALKDASYRDHVYAYIAQEDSPRPLVFQLDLLREVGFARIELLHKNGCFAAFGGIK